MKSAGRLDHRAPADRNAMRMRRAGASEHWRIQARRGNDAVLSGTFSGVKVAYLPTDRDLGVLIEIFSGSPKTDEARDPGNEGR